MNALANICRKVPWEGEAPAEPLSRIGYLLQIRFGRGLTASPSRCRNYETDGITDNDMKLSLPSGQNGPDFTDSMCHLPENVEKHRFGITRIGGGWLMAHT